MTQLFNAQETRVIVRAVRKDSRLTGVDISKDKKLTYMKLGPKIT